MVVGTKAVVGEMTGLHSELHPELHPWTGGTVLDVPALESWVQARIDAQQSLIDRLLAVDGTRTLENTLRPYDTALAELSSAASQAALLDSVYPDKAIRDTAQALTQKISAIWTALALNQQVYKALSEVDLTNADAATKHYVTRTLLSYRLAGVDRDDATRARIRELHDKAVLLTLAFARNVQEGANKVVIEDVALLAGLPPDYIASHAPDADGNITVTTDYPDYMPVMTFAKDAELRKKMFFAYNTRAFPANKQVLLDLLSTRQEIASTLGFRSWAALATADQMMGSATAMKKLIDDLEVVSRTGAEREYKMILDFARQHDPGLVDLDQSSRAYWVEQYRRTAYDFDSQSVRPYFPYDRVEKGVLETAERLFHVKFEPATDATVWDEAASAFDVFDGGEQIGRFYLDMHPREGKDKWFSAHPLIPGIAGQQIPEAALICNFPGGKSDSEGRDGKDLGLMQHSDVVTFFHEFGHLMHALLGGQQQWAGISGIATENDFVEVPSQMLEEFFRDAKLLASFATHYETGEPIPAELVEKMNRAGAFGRADWLRTQLFYTSYALDTHSQTPATLDLDALMKADYTRFLPYTFLDGNRMYASFTHLSGYSSNYYTYLFNKVIALDFFNQFDRDDLLGGPAAMRYRRSVLEPGGSKPGKEIVLDFLGREQSFAAFESWVGEEFAG